MRNFILSIILAALLIDGYCWLTGFNPPRLPIEYGYQGIITICAIVIYEAAIRMLKRR